MHNYCREYVNLHGLCGESGDQLRIYRVYLIEKVVTFDRMNPLISCFS